MKTLLMLSVIVAAGRGVALALGPEAPPAIAPEAPSGALTLGGVPQLLADKLKEAKPAGIVDFAGHVGGGGYLPLWSFHDRAGVTYVEAMNFGYRAIQGSKPGGIFMPLAVDATALSARLWNFEWARAHVTRSKFPNVFLGVAALLPLDAKGLAELKIRDSRRWLGAVASVRF